ncbi:MAG TPA: TolC family protein [Anaeromyxobacteraceae bacterium]|nr:TolC family protein [Anaeromyxobacteraceae bacterium]
MTTFGIAVALVLAQTAPAQGAPAAPAQGASTLTIETALDQALARNYDLQSARARMDQARELSWKAWSGTLPQIVASGSLTHNDFGTSTLQEFLPLPAGSPPIVLQSQNQRAAQIQATVPLIAPQAWFAISAANAGERANAEVLENVRRDVLFGTAQAYYGAATVKQVVAVQERQLAISLDREKDARIRFQAGTTPKVSLLRAEIDRARAEQDLKRAQNSYVSAKEALAALIDRPKADFEVEVPPSPRVPGDPDSLETVALTERPDLRAAQEQITAERRTRDSVLARYAPVVAAFARWQYSNATGFSGSATTWAVGLQATWTILDGLLRESDLRTSDAQIREAESNRSGLEVRARTEVRQARLDLDSAVANREKAKEQADLARENQRLVNVNFRAGAGTYLEVSDANTALLQAELSLVSEALAADLAALRLMRAAGVFNERWKKG